LKVELDVPGELRGEAGFARPLATPARRDVTLHLEAGTVIGVFSNAPLGGRSPHALIKGGP